MQRERRKATKSEHKAIFIQELTNLVPFWRVIVLLPPYEPINVRSGLTRDNKISQSIHMKTRAWLTSAHQQDRCGPVFDVLGLRSGIG